MKRIRTVWHNFCVLLQVLFPSPQLLVDLYCSEIFTSVNGFKRINCFGKLIVLRMNVVPNYFGIPVSLAIRLF
jgi:hypothetical protein